MVPPSLAFAGVLLNNQTLVNIAHEQCQLYRQAMRNESAGLWAHILLGTGIEDRNRWLTGNAWAAYGMMRVLATIQRSPWAGEMGGEISDLQNWVTEIMSTSQNHLVSWSRWLCWNALIVDR
jgi:rhamnogalacturonyl hydrolase YesR